MEGGHFTGLDERRFLIGNGACAPLGIKKRKVGGENIGLFCGRTVEGRGSRQERSKRRDAEGTEGFLDSGTRRALPLALLGVDAHGKAKASRKIRDAALSRPSAPFGSAQGRLHDRRAAVGQETEQQIPRCPSLRKRVRSAENASRKGIRDTENVLRASPLVMTPQR